MSLPKLQSPYLYPREKNHPLDSGNLLPGTSYWASLLAETVKNLSAMRETGVQSPGGEDPLEKEMSPVLEIAPLQYFCLESSMDSGGWWAPVLGGHKESD